MGRGSCACIMKRWIQYNADADAWVPWEAGELPSAESIFRSRFLCQFVAWINYLSAMENAPQGLEMPYPGTPIQYASFWKSLDWKPSSAWMPVYLDEIYVGGTVRQGVMIDGDAYAETEFSEIEKGDIIHPRQENACRMRNMMAKLRKRIDLCNAITTLDNTLWSSRRREFEVNYDEVNGLVINPDKYVDGTLIG